MSPRPKQMSLAGRDRSQELHVQRALSDVHAVHRCHWLLSMQAKVAHRRRKRAQRWHWPTFSVVRTLAVMQLRPGHT